MRAIVVFSNQKNRGGEVQRNILVPALQIPISHFNYQIPSKTEV